MSEFLRCAYCDADDGEPCRADCDPVFCLYCRLKAMPVPVIDVRLLDSPTERQTA